jgi:Rhs element Vgr protein
MPAPSPLTGADGALRLRILAAGQALDAPPVVSLQIRRAVNSIPWARIELSDGNPADHSFPLADAATLVPGTEIEIALGYGDSDQTVFKGQVVRFGLAITGANDSRLVLECRDATVAMTIARRTAHYVDQLDSDIASTLISDAGLTADVEATTATHAELVQHHCSDWDFMLARAEVNGRLVTVVDGTVAVKAPVTSGEPVLQLTYGQDIIEFQADIDARLQRASVEARGWDASNQAAVTATAEPVALGLQGNLSSATLAEAVGPDSLLLQAGGQADSASLSAWAQAWQQRAGLARVRGRVRFQGHAAAVPGALVALAGVGARFEGTAWLGAVTHRVSDGDWITEAELGLDPAWFVARHDVAALPAGGLLPAVQGLQIGVVKKLDADPAGQHRIQVTLPALAPTADGLWARLLQFHASSGFGAFFLPEVGDEVLLGYLHGDPSQPVVLGSLYSSRRAPPKTLEAANDIKTVVTRCGSYLAFDEKDKLITLETPAKNQLVFSDKDKTITLKDQNGNKIVLGPDGILLETPKDVVIKATGNIKATATQAIEATATADLKLAGLNVNASAQAGFKAQGTATAELSAAGQTTVKGALVMIN